jgi:uncharacterized protein (DUF1697 family)
MPRFIAFLRAINVGGRTVKMDRLRALFADAGFRNVETFIASGNVIFDSPRKTTAGIERKIEGVLREGLGYEVASFIRSPGELQAIVLHGRLSGETTAGTSVYVAFTRATPSAEAQSKLAALRSEIDDFIVEGREIYWISNTTMSQSTFSGALLERIIGMPATLRNITTVRKLADKYAVGVSL